MAQAIDKPAPKTSLKTPLVYGAIALGLAVLLWETVLEDHFIAKRWGVVEQGRIYRSGQLSRFLVERMLVDNKVDTVIDLNGLEPEESSIGHDQRAEVAACEKHGIEHVRYPLSGDGTGDIERYVQAIQKIVECRNAGKRVLVHCAAGSQRTGGVVASYRMLIEKKSPQTAYAELKRYDWQPSKDQILLDYVNAHIEHVAKRLVELGVLDTMPSKLPHLGAGQQQIADGSVRTVR